jgi:hypothetical protein
MLFEEKENCSKLKWNKNEQLLERRDRNEISLQLRSRGSKIVENVEKLSTLSRKGKNPFEISSLN